jgi:hypothetical protein
MVAAGRNCGDGGRLNVALWPTAFTTEVAEIPRSRRRL